QWAIIKSLTEDLFAGQGRRETDRSLFVVGDEKQSIFSFQGADVQALGEMQRYFMQRISDAGKIVGRISLNKSYRSLPEILSLVDAVFANTQASDGLMFEASTLEHIATRSGVGLIELWPLVESDDTQRSSPNVRLSRQLGD